MLLFKQLYQSFKKLVLILTIFALITKANKEDNIALTRILYIHYLLYFYKDKKNKVQALIDSSNKVSIITLAYALKLDLKICRSNVKT